jgi:hypothetical protein
MKWVFGRSRLLLGYLLLTHLAAAVLISYLNLPLVLTVLILLLLICSLWLHCRRAGWLGGRIKTTQLIFNHDGWMIIDSSQRRAGPLQLKRSVVLGPLAVIYFHSAWKRQPQSVVAFSDMVDADAWRNLLVRLRDPASWGQ